MRKHYAMMTGILIALTLLMVATAEAATVRFSWDAPASNVDGSELVLSGYKVYYNLEGFTETVIDAPSAETSLDVEIPLPPRDEPYILNYGVSAYNAAGESDVTRAVSELISLPTAPPKPPVIINIEIICSVDPCPVQINIP